MAYEFVLILLSVLVVSLISFVGVLALSLKQSLFNNLLFILVAFATGTLLAAALLASSSVIGEPWPSTTAMSIL